MELAEELSHARLVRVFGTVLLMGKAPALLMEPMRGGSLFDLLHNSRTAAVGSSAGAGTSGGAGSTVGGTVGAASPDHAVLTPPLQRRLVHEVAVGLCHLHEHGILHRDIKTANVLLDEALHAKICDFGVATRFSMQNGNGGEGRDLSRSVGPRRYMAPEVVFGAYGARADIFAFGMLTFEVLHAAIPFAGHDGLVSLLRIQRGARPPIELPPQLAGFALLITSCWHQMPERRPPSMATVVYMIEQCERTAAAREDPPCKV